MTTATAEAPAVTDEFPVDSYKDAAKLLRRPFTVNAVKFKVQATWAGDNAGAMIVAYIDARLAIERLNLVCPHLWKEGGEDPVAEPPYQQVAGGLLCRLTVDGITRADVGEGVGKGLISDALKRAAVHFGVGVSLYAIPQIRLFVRDGHLRDTGKKDQKGKPIFELTPNGLTRCRDIYEAWLESAGIAAFGAPLDHGDVEEAVGDAEEAEAPPAAPIGKDAATELLTVATASGLTLAQIHGWLANKGIELPPFESSEDAIRGLSTLTPDLEARFRKACDDAAGGS